VLVEAQGQQQTLGLGATAVGIVVAGAFNVWDDQVLASFGFLVAVPLLSVLVLLQWAGRAFALMRVGAHLEALEKRLREAVGAPPPVMTWEEMLEKARPARWWKPHPGWNDFGAFGVFAAIAVGAIVLGAWRGYDKHEGTIVVVTIVQSLVIGVVIVALASALATGRKRAREDYERVATSSSVEGQASPPKT
jgi:hypothetical protein